MIRAWQNGRTDRPQPAFFPDNTRNGADPKPGRQPWQLPQNPPEGLNIHCSYSENRPGAGSLRMLILHPRKPYKDVEGIQEFKEALLAVDENKFVLTGFGFLVWMSFFDRNDFITTWSYRRKLNELEAQRDYYRDAIPTTRRVCSNFGNRSGKPRTLRARRTPHETRQRRRVRDRGCRQAGRRVNAIRRCIRQRPFASRRRSPEYRNIPPLPG